MGSTSRNTSSTNYLNTPLTLDNNQNGFALAGNTGLQLGGQGNVSGSTNSGNTANSGNTNNSGSFSTTAISNALDGGAIQRAFDATDKSISAITDLTAKLVAQNSTSGVAALNFVEKANNAALAASNPVATATNDYNKTLMYAVAAVAAYFLFKALK